MFRCQTTNSVDASNLMEIPVYAEDAVTLDVIYRKDLETWENVDNKILTVQVLHQELLFFYAFHTAAKTIYRFPKFRKCWKFYY